MNRLNSIMVTGGAGFIGSNFIRFVFNRDDFNGIIVNVDKLTYAGNLCNLQDIDERYGGTTYFFEKADIGDYNAIKEIVNKYNVDTIVNFAAETHVDRSIYGPSEFINTNIIGTFTLLEVSREAFNKNKYFHFHHISTDEVYGSLGKEGYFYENSAFDPRSPYSASKASSDHLVSAYFHTYGLPVTISNCSNNYGPYQFPEKLIPLMIINMINEKQLPVYGDGKHIRDWLYVDDHNSALWKILTNGLMGETYNIGGNSEWENIKLLNELCEKTARFMGKDKDYYKKLITFVADRPGHDRRYAINCDKIKLQLGWKQKYTFETGLDLTVQWYLNNKDWVERIQTGAYKEWLTIHYGDRNR